MLAQADMYSLENSLDNNHLLQVRGIPGRPHNSLSLSLTHTHTLSLSLILQVSVSMSETGPGTDSAESAEVAPGAGGQMWSGGGEDRPEQLIAPDVQEQLMAPDVQEEVSLLEDQPHE